MQKRGFSLYIEINTAQLIEDFEKDTVEYATITCNFHYT